MLHVIRCICLCDIVNTVTVNTVCVAPSYRNLHVEIPSNTKLNIIHSLIKPPYVVVEIENCSEYKGNHAVAVIFAPASRLKFYLEAGAGAVFRDFMIHIFTSAEK